MSPQGTSVVGSRLNTASSAGCIRAVGLMPDQNSKMRRSISRMAASNHVGHFPELGRDVRGHGGRHLERLVNAHEAVEHEVVS